MTNTIVEKMTDRLVKSVADLKGKTIQDVKVNYQDNVYLLFDDETFAILKTSRGYSDCVEIELEHEIDGYEDLPTLVDLEVIRQVDYEQYKQDRAEAHAAQRSQQERAQYEALKRKYGD